MKNRKKRLIKMLTQNKLINTSSDPPTEDQKLKSTDLEILKQIVDDVSDIENPRSDNEINELLSKKERSMHSLRSTRTNNTRRDRTNFKNRSGKENRSMSLKSKANSMRDGSISLKDRSMSLRDRSMSLRKRLEDGEYVKYESVISLSDSSKLCPESEKRKEKVKKTIDEVSYHSNLDIIKILKYG